MFVGHAPSLEGCSRQLIGEPVRNFDEFLYINRQITFLSMAQCERNSMTGKWELTPIRINSCDDSALPNEFNNTNNNNNNNYLAYECQSNQVNQNQIYHDPYQAFYA